MTLCACGCGEVTTIISMSNNKLGRRKGEPNQYKLGHWRRGRGMDHLSRYEIRNDCWIWQGSVNNKGYGIFGKHTLAHRFFYRTYKGNIPHGKELDHLCGTPLCVNPDHLEAVSHQVNLRRGKGRSKLSDDLVREMRLLRTNTGVSYAKIAARFGIDAGYAYHVINFHYWKDIRTSAKGQER